MDNLHSEESLKINIVNKSDNPLPEYATSGSSGMDVRAHLPNPVILQSLEQALIHTGLFIELPLGFEAQIRPRSELAIKQGLTVLNTPGTVDSDYRGEIKVVLINLSGQEQIINNGERIAQMIISKVERSSFMQVEKLGDSLRGEGGFAHTGKA